MEAVTEEPVRSLDAFRSVFRNPSLRRVQLAWAGSNLGTWGYGVALAVYAYGHGGATAVGVVGLIRLIPAAIAAPFMGALGDRHPRRLVMSLSDLGRVVVVGAGAVVIWAHGAAILVYVLAAIGVVLSTAFRPAQAAIIPTLAATPQELTASNVVSSTIEALGIFAGPALGGIVLVLSGPAAVFALAALTFLWSALLILRIRVEEGPAAAGEPQEGAPPERVSFFRHTFAGFATVAKQPHPRLLVALFSAQTLVAGGLIVLEVVVARELLGRGNGWVGALSAAFGVGGLLGAVVSGALVARGRLALDFGTGILLWGLPLVLIGLWPTPAVALGSMALMGVGNTLVDVAGLTLLQRSVPDEMLARVFGVLETVFLATVALGAVVAPVLVRSFGVRPALFVFGVFLPLVVAASGRHLFALDKAVRAPERELALLRGVSFLAPLSQPVLEHLAGRLVSMRFSQGERVFEQGDVGDRFYVVAEGAVEIDKDGALIASVPPGGYFGEIALLHDVTRQAGATAAAQTELLALDGEEFVDAVTGSSSSRAAADAAVRSYGVGIGLPR
jgi:MFS family permease